MDDKEKGKSVHGFNIDPREHDHALRHIEEHMSSRELEERADYARHHEGGAHFQVGGEEFKLKHRSDGSLSIHRA